MAPVLRSILLLATIVLPTLSIPTQESQSALFRSDATNRDCVKKSLFTRVRDSIIENIWDVPKKSECHNQAKVLTKFESKYERDVVLRFKIKTEDEAKAFSEAASILYLDIWDHASEWVDLRIAKDMLPSFLTLLPRSLQNSYTPLIHDLARAVQDTFPSSSHTESWRTRHRPLQPHHHDVFFHNYQPLSVLHAWLKLQSTLMPNRFEYFSIGSSAEGRDIPAVRVGAPLSEQEPDEEVNGRKTILVVGGSHAREWISTSTIAYLALSFAAEYGQRHSTLVTKILKHYDMVFIPTINPDGYEYTWSNDRLWRKNRQATSLPFCPGIDIDRSFGYKWNGDTQADNPCAEAYAGEHPFQAVEAKVLAEWARNQTRDKNVVFASYLNLHSYSQKVLYPYSFSCDIQPANLEDLEEVAMDMAKSLRLTTGHFYEVGSACESQYAVVINKDGKKVTTQIDADGNGGSSLDYFYEELRVRLPFEIKLRDTGTYGFLLPKDNIVPTGRETFEAVVGLGRYLLGQTGIENANDEDDRGETTPVDSAEQKDESNEWEHARPGFLFRTGHSTVEVAVEHDEDEWERVYDPELRMRRR